MMDNCYFKARNKCACVAESPWRENGKGEGDGTNYETGFLSF